MKPSNLGCPRCGAPMHARTNSRTGQKFWGCTDYPRCTGTRDTDGMSADERRTSMREERGRVRSRWSEDS